MRKNKTAVVTKFGVTVPWTKRVKHIHFHLTELPMKLQDRLHAYCVSHEMPAKEVVILILKNMLARDERDWLASSESATAAADTDLPSAQSHLSTMA